LTQSELASIVSIIAPVRPTSSEIVGDAVVGIAASIDPRVVRCADGHVGHAHPRSGECGADDSGCAHAAATWFAILLNRHCGLDEHAPTGEPAKLGAANLKDDKGMRASASRALRPCSDQVRLQVGYSSVTGGGMDMVRQLLISGVVSMANIAIHALAMVAIVRTAHIVAAREILHGAVRLLTTMIATVSVLMITHISEVIVWSVAYWIIEAAPPGSNLLYFAFVNYTTLGYGDVTPVDRWRLVGPMTAMNGVLLFGWSTAVIFEILRRTIAHEGSRSTKWRI